MKTIKRDRAHPRLITPAVRRYLDAIHRPRDSVLAALEKDAEKNDVPISGHLIGNTLSILARGSGAKNILEVGTATGYSGIWLARAVAANAGKLTTIEMDPERQKIAKSALKKAGISEAALNMKLGDAKKIVPQMAKSEAEKFDMVFMDVGEKKLYSELLGDCIRVLKKGGLLILDDTLYRGVALNSIRTSKARVMRDFNRSLIADKRLDYVILPVGDGLTVAIKR